MKAYKFGILVPQCISGLEVQICLIAFNNVARVGTRHNPKVSQALTVNYHLPL